MKKVRITVKKIAHYEDLMAEYENPIEHACSMELDQTFVCNGWKQPEYYVKLYHLIICGKLGSLIFCSASNSRFGGS